MPVPATGAAAGPCKSPQQYGCGPIQFTGSEMRSTSGTCSSTTSSSRRPPLRATFRGVRPLGARHPLAALGAHRGHLQLARTPSASITSRWSFSSAVRWPTTSPICCSIPSYRAGRRRRSTSIGSRLLEQEPDAGLGNGGLGRLAACFLDSMATMRSRPWATGCATNTASSSRPSRTAGNRNSPTIGCAARTRGRSRGRTRRSKCKLDCSSRCAAALARHSRRPSTLIGIPYDRPVVGYGGKTINTLRLWAAAAPDYFDFQRFQPRRFRRRAGRDAGGRIADAGAVSRRLHQPGPGLALRAGVFPRRLFAGGPGAALPARQRRLEPAPEKAAIQLNDTHPAMAVPELMRILLDEAQARLGPGLGPHQRTLAYTNHTLLPEALEKWPVDWFETLLPRHLEIIYEINRRLLDDVRTRFPGDEDASARISLIEEARASMSAWPIWRSSARTAPTAWRRFIRNCCARRRSRTWPRCFRSASTTRPTASRPAVGCCCATPRSPAPSPRPSATAGSPTWRNLRKLKPLADDKGFRDSVPQGQARGQDRIRRLAQDSTGPDRRTRTPSSIARSSASTNTSGNCSMRCASSCSTTACGENPEAGHGAADIFLRRQGGARLSPRQAHHQVHQQPGRHHRRRPASARTHQGRVPAGVHVSPSRSG